MRPARLAGTAALAAGYAGFVPDACLVNRYQPGTRLSLHQDQDEVSPPPSCRSRWVSPATFLFGGPTRRDPTRRIPLRHGDVVVWGGPARRYYHGVPLATGEHPLTGPTRLNLTLRKAG